jgi:hypothetical protein
MKNSILAASPAPHILATLWQVDISWTRLVLKGKRESYNDNFIFAEPQTRS